VDAAALHWYKPPALTGTYKAGFEGDITLGGSSFVSQTGVPILPLDSAHQGIVTIEGGDLASTVTEKITIDTAIPQTMTFITATLTMLLSPNSCLITGPSKLNGSTLTFPYAGVVLQKTNTAAGVLKGSTLTSPVSIVPATP
jgi:hypothetical protein